VEPKKALERLPRAPGVYLFRDARGDVLYVGKARDLRNRVRSYFQSARNLPAKTQALVERLADVEWITTGSEHEAYLLEESLIKSHRPKYNVLLRDDKHYPFLKLTAHPFPRLVVARRREDDGALYFGPYPSAGAVRAAERLIRRLFPLRTCTDRKFETVTRPCLLYHIKRCPAPCVGYVDAAAYGRIVDEVNAFLSGRRDEVRRELARRMAEAAEALRFEEAAELRDRLRALEEVLAEQTVVLRRKVDLDAVGVAREGRDAVGEVFQVREGQVVGRRRYLFRLPPEAEDGEILTRLLVAHYQREAVPPEILVPTAPPADDGARAFLAERRGGPVRLLSPRRGEKRDLLALALRNAAEGLDEVREEAAAHEEALTALASALGLDGPPRRIEGYDISNTQGTLSVAAMVVFREGTPAPSHYRRFNIRTVVGADDFASLREAVARRMRRLSSRDASFGERPDLLLIDGGRGQLAAVLAALAETPNPPAVAALAKREEAIYVPGVAEPLRLPAWHPGLRLLQRVRDEAHRFANAGHGRRRSQALRRSRLDAVEGIGPKRRRALLSAFGSVEGIRQASVEEIVRVGIPAAVARRLKEELE
jgi:excinuclease ABC subunit C